MPKTKDQNRLARERIVAALTALMSEKDYAGITITEITQRADVSRMTYYRNYSSKEDILRKFMSDVGSASTQRSWSRICSEIRMSII